MILSHQQTDNVFVFVFIVECNVDHFYQPNTRFCFCLVCWLPLKKNNWDQWRHSTPISECRFQISYVFQRWFEFSLQNSRFKKKNIKKKNNIFDRLRRGVNMKHWKQFHFQHKHWANAEKLFRYCYLFEIFFQNYKCKF